jgi:hypothetical protein
MIRSTFAIPTLLALLTLFALVIALTGDGWRDVSAWAGLFIPVALVAWIGVRKTARNSAPRSRAKSDNCRQ